MRKILVTGAGGLIGSEVVRFFCQKGLEVVGIDNNMRQVFFGEKGDTTWNISKLEKENARFTNHSLDIRDRSAVEKFIQEISKSASSTVDFIINSEEYTI